MKIDEVTRSVILNNLKWITEEMGEYLARAAFSTNIKIRRDCSCALYTAKGDMLAQGTFVPVHLGIMSQTLKALLEKQDYEIRLATLAERNRIAREIHDNVGHMLTRSILQLGALSVINKDETVGEAINDLSGTLNTAMTSIRSSVHDLHDDSIALKPAVEDCIRPLKDRFAVSCDYDFSERMSRDVKLCFIGVIKEALSNTAKHSDGDSIKIIIREHPALYQLSIADNGSCPEKIDESGMGLANMRERAASLNGNINITSGSKGFRIFLSVPKQNLTERRS